MSAAEKDEMLIHTHKLVTYIGLRRSSLGNLTIMHVVHVHHSWRLRGLAKVLEYLLGRKHPIILFVR